MNKRHVAILMLLILFLVIFTINVSATHTKRHKTTTPKTINATGSADITVIDRATREVLYNAKVSIYENKGNFVASDDTSNGDAFFANLKAGAYRAVASAPGYLDFKRAFSVKPGKTTSFTMALKGQKPTPKPTKGKCTDTDGGKNKFVGGKTYIDPNDVHYDQCFDNSVIEYYCSRGGVSKIEMKCSKKGCSNGACIK